jgi:Mrp family chromosome partitioning ATPase
MRQLARIARRRWLVLFSVTAVAALAAVVVAANETKQYVATSRLLLDNSQLVEQPASAPTVVNPDPERDLNTKIALIRAAPVARGVDTQLHLGWPLGRLVNEVAAQADGTSNIVSVTASDRSPARALAIANSFADEYVAFRTGIARSSLEAAADNVRSQLAALGRGATATPKAIALSKQLRDLSLASTTQTGGAVVVERATRPTRAGADSALTSGLVGALVGFLLAVAVVAVLELTDRRLKDVEQLASGLDVRVIAELAARQGTVTSDPDHSRTDGYDKLAGELILAERRGALSSVMITSPGEGDGKTTVTLGIARALARLGRRILVIETDFGRSSVLEDHERQAARGLYGVLTGVSTLADEVVELNGRGGDGATHPIEDGGISLLPAGDPNGGVRRVLASSRIADVLATRGESVDFVIVDGPSTEHVHESLGLVDAVDAALMVCRLGWTRRESLTRGLEILELVGMNVLGLAVTDARRGFASWSQKAEARARVDVSANGLSHGHDPASTLQGTPRPG